MTVAGGVGGTEVRVGIVGAGTIAGVHALALRSVPLLYPALDVRPSLVAVADINPDLAAALASRFGAERTETDWRAVTDAADIDLVVVAVPPARVREICLAAAAAGKHVVSEKPLGTTATEAAEILAACRSAGVFHGLAAGYRWSSAVRAMRDLITGGSLGEIRSVRASFLLDYAADPAVPLLWRFQRSLAGGGILIDVGYHLVDCIRFLVGEIEAVQALSSVFVASRPLPSAGAVGNRGGASGRPPDEALGSGVVDTEDAAAALLTLAGGGYCVLETSRVTLGRKASLELQIYGSTGSVRWDLERPDEFEVCLSGDPATSGFRRVLVGPQHPGAAALLVAGTEGTSIGWLGQECAMWGEFLGAIGEGRQAHADFADAVRAGAVIDAIYAAAATGTRVKVATHLDLG